MHAPWSGKEWKLLNSPCASEEQLETNKKKSGRKVCAVSMTVLSFEKALFNSTGGWEVIKQVIIPQLMRVKNIFDLVVTLGHITDFGSRRPVSLNTASHPVRSTSCMKTGGIRIREILRGKEAKHYFTT